VRDSDDRPERVRYLCPFGRLSLSYQLDNMRADQSNGRTLRSSFVSPLTPADR